MEDLQTPEIETTIPHTPNPNRQRAGSANGKLGANKKTPEGRTTSAKNATKHGLTAKQFNLLDCETPQGYALFEYRQMDALRPRDYHEFLLVKKLVDARWAIERAEHMQIAALNRQFDKLRRQPGAGKEKEVDYTYFQAFEALAGTNSGFTLLQRYLSQHHRIASRAQAELLAYRKANPTPSAPFDWQSFVISPTEIGELPAHLTGEPEDAPAETPEFPNEGKLRSHFVSKVYIGPDSKPAKASIPPAHLFDTHCDHALNW